MPRGRPKKGHEKKNLMEDIQQNDFNDDIEEVVEEVEEDDVESELDFDNHNFGSDFIGDYEE